MLARVLSTPAGLRPHRVAVQKRSMAAMASSSQLVSCEWLSERLGDTSIKVLDGTWYMPNSGKVASEEFKTERIAGSQCFDIDVVADTSSGLKHMLPSEAVFEAAMDAYGISNRSTVVVYDRAGIFSAPRVWWTFKVMGHENVVVLEGGLPAWKSKGLPVDSAVLSDDVFEYVAAAVKAPGGSRQYKAVLDSSKVRSLDQMKAIVESLSEQVMDARGPGRFEGTEPEPRAGLKSGHMPGARNVPFPSMLQGGSAFKSAAELEVVFTAAGVDLGAPLVATCGSGLTAAVLALGAYQASGKLLPIYDGSWSEWGTQPDTEVAGGPA